MSFQPNNSNHPAKWRLDELYNTISGMLWELISNDNIMKHQLELRVFSEVEREVITAELFKERLEALTLSSRWQLSNLPMVASAQGNYNKYCYGWGTKRQRLNYNEDAFYNCSTPSNAWYGYNNAQSYYPPKQTGPNNRKRKATSNKPASTVTTNTDAKRKAVSSLQSAPQLASTSSIKTNKNTTSVQTVPLPKKNKNKKKKKSKKTVAFSLSATQTNAIAYQNAVKKVTTTIKNTSACNNVNSSVGQSSTASSAVQLPIKTVHNSDNKSDNLPSLFTVNLSPIKLKFGTSDGISFRETSFTSIKIEPSDHMYDDLENHL